MTENKKLSEILQEQINNLEAKSKAQDDLIKALEIKLKIPAAQSTTLTPEPKHMHTKGAGEHVEFDCPDCQKEYDQKVIKQYQATVKAMKKPELCEDCGDIYDKEEKDDCPTCHRH